MNKRIGAFVVATIMTASLAALPANAMSYTVDGAEERTFGPITSLEDYEIPAADSASDYSKNAAYAPPGFGTPESYLPNRSEKLIDLRGIDGSDNVAVGPGSLTDAITGGSVSVGADGFPTVDGGTGSYGSYGATTPANSVMPNKATTKFTAVSSNSYNSKGKLGTIEIPSLKINYTITEGTSNENMKYGAGHVIDSSIWDGNVCLAGHNRGVKNNFGKIHTLKAGDKIVLNTVYGTRTYKVSTVEKVLETNMDCLSRSTDNRITLITCVANERDYRYVVTAYEAS